MKIFVLNKFTSVRKEDGTLINYSSMKLISYLYTKWKNGNFQERYLPSVKEMIKETGMDHKTISKSLNELQSVRINDKYGSSCSLLRIENAVNKSGEKTKLYRIAFPEHGYEDPENFAKKGGGDATLSMLGGYFTIDEDIQALNLPAGQELVLAAMENILSFSKGTEIPDFIFNTSMFAKYGKFEGMNRERLKWLIRELKDKGIFKAEVVKRGKFWGWKNIELIINKDVSQLEECSNNEVEQEENQMTEQSKDEIVQLIKQAMEKGDYALAKSLAEMANEQPVEKNEQPVEKPKLKKGEKQEIISNEYVRLVITAPEKVWEHTLFQSYFGSLREYVEKLDYDMEQLEDSGMINILDDFKGQGAKIKAEVLSIPEKVNIPPMTYWEQIAASKAENDRLFGNGNVPDFLDERVEAAVGFSPKSNDLIAFLNS